MGRLSSKATNYGKKKEGEEEGEELRFSLTISTFPKMKLPFRINPKKPFSLSVGFALSPFSLGQDDIWGPS